MIWRIVDLWALVLRYWFGVMPPMAGISLCHGGDFGFAVPGFQATVFDIDRFVGFSGGRCARRRRHIGPYPGI
jgi:hypothetical protein